MLFSDLVATLRADLDAIRDDLGEFVSTVKTDASAALGLALDEGNGLKTAQTKYLQWEEELWDNPDLLCENPLPEEEWATFLQEHPVQEEEVELLLSGNVSEVVPELYREIVPSRTTHTEFFQRLIYHRDRLNTATRTRMKDISQVQEEEETRWEDDSIEEEPVIKNSEDNILSASLVAPKASPPPTDGSIAIKNESAELTRYKQEVEKLLSRVKELETALEESEQKRIFLERQLSDSFFPHKKPVPNLEEKQTNLENPPQTESAESENEEEQSAPVASSKNDAPNISQSWEALPSNNSSNEETSIVDLKQVEDEEDDWE